MALRIRSLLAAAALFAAATASVFTSSMPLKTGLMVAALLGVIAGMLTEKRPDAGNKGRVEETA